MTPRVAVLAALLILLLAPSLYAQNKEFADSARTWMERVEANPDDPVARVEAAYWAGLSIQPYEALRLLESIDTATFPDSSVMPELYYWIYRAAFLNMTRQHERELAVAKEYTALYPDAWATPVLLARAFASLGRTEELNRLIDEEEADSGGNPTMLMDAGARHLLDHGYAEASARLTERQIAWYEARPLVEGEDDFRFDYARALYRSGRWDEAETRMLQLADEDPDDEGPQVYLALLAARKGDLLRAAESDAKLAELEPPLGSIYRARVAAVRGDIELAMALLEQALEEGVRMPAELKPSLVWEFAPYLDHPAYRDFLRPRE